MLIYAVEKYCPHKVSNSKVDTVQHTCMIAEGGYCPPHVYYLSVLAFADINSCQVNIVGGCLLLPSNILVFLFK